MSERRFVDSMGSLIRQMPKSSVKGRIVVDQVYAHYQHAGLDFHHPQGGEALYITTPLFQKGERYLRFVGAHVVNSAGRIELQRAMEEVVEDLSDEVFQRAPREFHDLRESGNPIVEVDGVEVYNRPPHVGRLSEVELRMKGRLSYLRDPNRYKRGR